MYDTQREYDVDEALCSKDNKGSRMNKYAQLMAEERERQISEEGWSPEHDDEHVNGELANVAACFSATNELYLYSKHSDGLHNMTACHLYPWEDKYYKKASKNRKQQLIVAGALIIAELERLERAEVQNGQ